MEKIKKVYVRTLGCQMNKSDTERILGILSHFGYENTQNERLADLLIINTCSIRQLSADKAYSYLGLWGKWKRKKKPNLKIAMCGCVAQIDKKKVFKRAPYVDLVFGTHNIYELPSLIKKIENGERVCAAPDTAYAGNEDFDIKRVQGVTSWIPIIEGCNNFCTYCIVPYTRGRERSRAPEDIIKEAQHALAQGFKEITLLGQNVDSYGKDLKNTDTNLAKLLTELNSLEGKFRIRFTTSYPTDITDELIYTIKKLEKVCEYFHIPMQSGNSAILKDMNRRYNREEYVKIAQKIRNTFQDVAITSDFIAGFPGEDAKQFEDTLSVMDELEFDYCNTAAYSPREMTPAATWTDKFIDETVKTERLKILNDKNKEICLKSNKKYVGKTLEILVENYNKGILSGRTRNNKIVHFEGDEGLVGQFVKVEITKATTWYLKAGKVGF